MPVRVVGIEESVPRISTGASGFGSNESMCVTPPAIQSRMTDFAFAFVFAAEALCPGKNVEAMPSEPTRSRSRRDSNPFQASGGEAGIGGILLAGANVLLSYSILGEEATTIPGEVV